MARFTTFLGVDPAFTTRRISSTNLEISKASLTGINGGESIIILSKCAFTSLKKCLIIADKQQKSKKGP